MQIQKVTSALVAVLVTALAAALTIAIVAAGKPAPNESVLAKEKGGAYVFYPGQKVKVIVSFTFPKGYHLNETAPLGLELAEGTGKGLTFSPAKLRLNASNVKLPVTWDVAVGQGSKKPLPATIKYVVSFCQDKGELCSFADEKLNLVYRVVDKGAFAKSQKLKALTGDETWVLKLTIKLSAPKG